MSWAAPLEYVVIFRISCHLDVLVCYCAHLIKMLDPKRGEHIITNTTLTYDIKQGLV